MNYKEYIFTASEITQLEYILSIMPDDHRVERIGVEHLLRQARGTLEECPFRNNRRPSIPNSRESP